MIAIFQTCHRALGAGAAALLLAGPALAQADVAVSDTAETTANQIVVRDAQSGALRAATAAEARQLASPARERLVTLRRTHPNGAKGVRLSNAFLNHSLIGRLADGSLVEQCFHTAEEAAVAHQTMTFTKAPVALPTE